MPANRSAWEMVQIVDDVLCVATGHGQKGDTAMHASGAMKRRADLWTQTKYKLFAEFN